MSHRHSYRGPSDRPRVRSGQYRLQVCQRNGWRFPGPNKASQPERDCHQGTGVGPQSFQQFPGSEKHQKTPPSFLMDGRFWWNVAQKLVMFGQNLVKIIFARFSKLLKNHGCLGRSPRLEQPWTLWRWTGSWKALLLERVLHRSLEAGPQLCRRLEPPWSWRRRNGESNALLHDRLLQQGPQIGWQKCIFLEQPWTFGRWKCFWNVLLSEKMLWKSLEFELQVCWHLEPPWICGRWNS